MFNAIDVFFVFVLLIFALMAAAKGLIKEFFGKASVICGIAAAVVFYGRLAFYASNYIKNEIISRILSFLVIFIVVYLLIKIIQHLSAKIFSSEIMGGLDHALGFLFGCAEGLAVIAFLIVLMRGQPWIDFRKILSGSFFYKMLADIISGPSLYMQGFFA
ncbi:CvpA family protein [Treponema parvum]|uniref:CvpA family protein n=1 Tax=Treponema parvum TaxID=138851 RepID=A0A975F026_9SPIR|nr:CvpA family protein [Treponema parvum]QTQ11917.1 CvpA family protein [Treponema parvum]